MAEIGSPLSAPHIGPGIGARGGSHVSALAFVPQILARHALAERDRWGLWVPVLIAIGILAYFALATEPPAWTGGMAALAAAMGLMAAGSAPLWLRGALRLAATVAGLIALGFAAAQLQTALVTTEPLKHRIGPIGLTGVISEIEPFPNGARIVLDDAASRPGGEGVPERVRIRLRGNEQPPMAPGDRIRLSAVLSPPPAPVIPGGYDFQREAYFSNLGAVGFGVGEVTVLPVTEAGAPTFMTWIAQLRHAVSKEVRRVIAPPTSAVILALLVGERRAIDERTIAAVRDSGLAHLLAISGLHIGLVALLVMIVLRSALALVPAIALRYPVKKWAACGSALAAGFYTLLAGAPPPSQRAFVMVLLVLLAVLVDRRTTPMRLVAIAAVVLCLTQPVTVLGPSFQMSFFAVMALIAFYEWTTTRPAWMTARAERWRLPAYLAGVAMSSLVATLATAPFVVSHFNRLAVYGLFANLVAVPMFSVWIMPWAIVALILMPFGFAGLALVPMGWGVDVIIWVAKWVAGWPDAVVQLPPMPSWALAASAAGLLWLCLWRTRWRFAGLVPLVAAAIGILANTPPDLLIDGGGKLIAVRAADGGLLLSSARTSAMARQTWLRTGAKAASVEIFPAAGISADGRLSCDGAGCIWRTDGHVIAIARSGDALAEDCRRADAVISVVPVRRRCPAAHLIIDRFDLWRDGAHALWIGPNAIRSLSVDDVRGERPWVPERVARRAAVRTAKTAAPPPEDEDDDDGPAVD